MGLIKILHVNKLYNPDVGGIETTVRLITEGLVGKTDNKVLCCQKRGPTKLETLSGVEVLRASSLGIFMSLPVSFSFYRYFKQIAKDYEIMQLHMPFPLGDLACFLSGYKGKVVLWWHSDILRQKRAIFFYKPLMRWMLNRADKIIVATEGHIIGSDYLGPYQDKCVIIPFAVDPEIRDRANAYWVKQETGVSSTGGKKINFLFVGRLVYYKGCIEMLEAFRTIKNARLTIVGDGPMKMEMMEFVTKNSLMNSVCFKGEVSKEDLFSCYEDCDALVLPSTYKSEAFGLVQIEAMCFGKPVINTRLDSGVPYVSIDGQTGITVAPGNAEELGEAMRWMAEHKDERLDMGKNARARVESHYTTEIMIGELFSMYRSLLGEKR